MPNKRIRKKQAKQRAGNGTPKPPSYRKFSGGGGSAHFQIGDFVTFDYSLGFQVHDKFPKILCLHNHWRGCVHGLNFNYLTQQEINYVKAVINPDFAREISKTDLRIATQLVKVRLHGNLNITSPHDFYVRFVRGFIRPRGWDPYRRYNINKIQGSRVITRRALMTGQQASEFNDYINKFQHFNGSRLGSDQETTDFTPPKTPKKLSDL